jgi:acyl-CoA synthetase (AMP-forming)/AMP-acid ligase II
MPPSKRDSLWGWLGAADALTDQSLSGAGGRVFLRELLGGSVFGEPAEALRGRSVLLSAADQLAAAIALIELDGIARRLVLCPPDLDPEHLSYVIAAAEVDAAVADRASIAHLEACGALSVLRAILPTTASVAAEPFDRGDQVATEWVLLTSGTTGAPKLVAHTLASLTGAFAQGLIPSPTQTQTPKPVIWSTFYDIRRYGGLQIFLRAVTSARSMVLSSADEPLPAFLARAGEAGVTHISATPSHWRKVLMSPAAPLIAPEYVRLSGEIADQAVLDHLRETYPAARISHAFASTEAGLVFDVTDGLAGVPAGIVAANAGVEMKVVDGSLRVRSDRTASRYLGEGAPVLRDAEGFVDTSDMLELHDGRYRFAGRRDGVINVGGRKVHPEEVEAVIHRHPGVQMALVRAKKSPVTGALVMADVVLRQDSETAAKTAEEQKQEILHFCRGQLAAYKVPVAINLVASLAISASGKLTRYA